MVGLQVPKAKYVDLTGDDKKVFDAILSIICNTPFERGLAASLPPGVDLKNEMITLIDAGLLQVVVDEAEELVGLRVYKDGHYVPVPLNERMR